MTTNRLTIAMVLAAAVTLPASAARAGSTCADLLGTNAYRCQVRSAADVAPATRCLVFQNAPTLSVGSLRCSCLPKGKLAKITFGAAADFLCVGREAIPSPVPGGDPTSATAMLSGSATRSGIRRGFSFRDADGRTEMLECVVDPTCALDPAT